MNRIESAANAGVELDTLEFNESMSAPILTPVLITATAFAAGGAVGYVYQARHGAVDETVDGVRATGDISDLSVAELVQARQDAI